MALRRILLVVILALVSVVARVVVAVLLKIDRSRDMYDKRVKPEVARKYDYFHHELVTTLAVGDASKLGSAYPGATVSA